jgi:hypothetical protein
MSEELSAVEESVKEVLIDLMTERVMSVGVQASSMRGVQASPSTAAWIWALPSHHRKENQAQR